MAKQFVELYQKVIACDVVAQQKEQNKSHVSLTM